MQIPDAEIDNELAKQLQAMGLNAIVSATTIETGLNGLVVHRDKCEVVRAQTEMGIVVIASLQTRDAIRLLCID